MIAPAFATQLPPSEQAVTQHENSAPAVPNSSVLHRVMIPQFTATLAARPIPALVIAGKPAEQSVGAFIQRVSLSSPTEHEQIRALIKQASGNVEITNAVATTAFANRTVDFARTLTALSVLGELRNPAGEAALTKFVTLPLPTTGHVVEGEIVERSTLEQLQMKAIQGLAYAQTATAEKEVLRNVSENPSRVVRSEAIEAYLYNHNYSEQARQALAATVKPADRIFLDRPHLHAGTTAGDFNAQLARFVALHPELKAPAPVHVLQARIAPLLITADKQKDAAVKPALLRKTLAPPQL
jgi:hypothetical protein